MHVIGTAGHVDHGKSTLVHALSGIDPDRFSEEKRRGLTIDLGFAWCTLPSGREIGIIDVPGHERFIRNMLAGVGGIDAALFIVAADEGWMPQSAEHLQILDFLEVGAGIVAITKIDTVDEEMVALVTSELRDRIAGTVLEGCPVVGVSAPTGEGIDELTTALDDLLAGVEEAADRSRPRLFVDRAFTITGAGTVVTGTLTGGSMSVDDEVEILPQGTRARIRTLQTHRRPVQRAVPGSRVAANLVGVDRDEVSRGDAVVEPGAWRTTKVAAVRLRASRGIDHMVSERGAYEMYLGSAEVPCRIKFLSDVSGRDGRNPALRGGEDVLTQLYLDRPLPLEIGDRFIVRDTGRWETVAGGVVLDPDPGRIRRADDGALERLEAREDASGVELAATIVAERGIVDRDTLPRLIGASAEMAAEVADRPEIVTTPSFVLAQRHEAFLRETAMSTLASHHETQPLDPGMPREALRSALHLDARAFGELIDRWEQAGLVVAEGAVVRLPDHGITLSASEREEADRILGTLRRGGVSPPATTDLASSEDLLAALERTGELVRVDASIAYPADVMRGVEEQVVRLIAAEGSATVAEVRDAVGTSRKYAVPLLEHLDATGVTQRRGDTRVLGPRGRKLAEEL